MTLSDAPAEKPSTAIRPLRLAAILNGGGGTMKARGVDVLRAELATAFERHGLAADIIVCRGNGIVGRAKEAVQRVKDGLLDVVVAGGGDGTIRCVAGVLAGTDIPMGILPLGTLNHFARDLGIPTDLDEAVAVLAAGHKRRVDVAEVNGRVFVNNSSIGLYAHMVVARDAEARRHGLSKWIAMLLALWHVLRHFPLRRLEIHTGGRTALCRTPLLFVGNNEYDLQLPDLGRRVALDASRLWVCFAKARSPLSLVLLALRLGLGRGGADPQIETLQTEGFEVRSRSSRVLVACDGEVEALAVPLRYRSRPGELSVIVPLPGQT
jgi:diacylglycerol kinase family enzyme